VKTTPSALRAASPPSKGGDFVIRTAFLLLLVFASCAKPSAQQESSGRPPQRIISVVPNVTETLFAFGLGERVIAVGDYDQFPPEVQKKPRVGGLINPNIEKIIEMHPDLVVTYGSQDVLRDRLQSVGIHMYPFTHGNVEQTLNFMIDLGHVVGSEAQAGQVVLQIRKAMDDARTHAPPSRPKVLLVHNRGAGTLGSFYSVGRRAFQHDLIEIAGGQNLFRDVDSETLQPTLEEVISRKPQIILETLAPGASESEITQRKKDWEKLGLAKERVYIERESYLLVPGPRLGLAATRISEIIRGTR
jgi:iron complex transport system substrate-binding protein